MYLCGFFVRNVSTHDLTKRSTEALQDGIIDVDVSTHDLTKRSTAPVAPGI